MLGGAESRKLAFEIGDATAHGRGRHFQTASRLRKAVRLDDLGEDEQRVEVGHHCLNLGKQLPEFSH
jgi:hypothetical protein